MSNIEFDQETLRGLTSRTVIITGGAGGIGAATARIFNEHGANVVIADIPASQGSAEKAIASLPYPDHALFVPVDILNWDEMKTLFTRTVEHFGDIHTVVANAGIMESAEVLDMNNIDSEGNLLESTEAFKVIDVNLKGTLNTLRLAMHHMKSSSPNSNRKSIILIASTSGYWGGTGVSAYIASKHGIIGLLRAAQPAAKKHNLRITAIAPFFTPTRITAGFADEWHAAGLEGNTPESVGTVVAQTSIGEIDSGSCILVAGKFRREMEFTRTALMPRWMGDDVVDFMKRAFDFISSIGGYRLPKT